MNYFFCLIAKLVASLRHSWRSYKLLEIISLEGEYSSQYVTKVGTISFIEADFFLHLYSLYTRPGVKHGPVHDQLFRTLFDGINENAPQRDLKNKDQQDIMRLKYRVWKQNQLQQMAMFFITFGLISFLEAGEYYLSYIPVYFLFKFILLMFLAVPFLKGGEIVYFEYLQPFAKQKENEYLEKHFDLFLIVVYELSNAVMNIFFEPITVVKGILIITKTKLSDGLMAVKTKTYEAYVFLGDSISSAIHFITDPITSGIVSSQQGASNAFDSARNRVRNFNLAIGNSLAAIKTGGYNSVVNVYEGFISLVFFWRRWDQKQNIEEQVNNEPLMNNTNNAAPQADAVVFDFDLNEASLNDKPKPPVKRKSRNLTSFTRLSTPKFTTTKKILLTIGGFEDYPSNGSAKSSMVSKDDEEEVPL